MSNRGLFPMRRHRHKEYNIFQLPDGTFEGRVFDYNRRVYAKTDPQDTIEKAIKITKWSCEAIAKGQFGCYNLVDEGKEIREKEEKDYLKFKKEMRKLNRTKGIKSSGDFL